MPELLLELFSEEIPARMQDAAAGDLRRLVLAALDGAKLAYGDARAYATPRRLCLVVEQLERAQPERVFEQRGPRVDAPEQARQGFFRSLVGRQNLEFSQVEDKKGRYHLARYVHGGQPTTSLLAKALPPLLAGFPWPKSMRWGEGDARWVRPLHRIVCLFDEVVVRFEFAGVASEQTTEGHRFMAPEPFTVMDFDDYQRSLQDRYVVLDGDERRKRISEEAQRLAANVGCELKTDPGLLDELKGLVEWPAPLIGRIDNVFMGLPPEVLVTAMRTHQKYLALQDSDGRLAPYFITVANIDAADGGAAIVEGNERVLNARLSDARFFWELDKKIPLKRRVAALDRVVFHADLGTVGDKVRRMLPLALWLSPLARAMDPTEVERAAYLAKADLATGMVGEFPELQGLMGSYYAEAQGEGEAVVRAIKEHYRPLGPSDAVPTGPEGTAVALADKLDTLVGFFGVGVKPTGSGDPFALRRAALGVIRLVLENGLRLPLLEAVRLAGRGYGGRIKADGLPQDLLAFFVERLKVHLRGEGLRHDHAAAVLGAGADDDLCRVVARTRALARFIGSGDGQNLLAGHRRATNILRIEEKKDERAYDGAGVDPKHLDDPAERALYDAIETAGPTIAGALAKEHYDEAMRALAALRPPVDAFFEAVMVNADDASLRRNRLELLGDLRGTFAPIADFSVIEEG